MADDFEEQKKKLLGQSLPDIAARQALSDPLHIRSNIDKLLARSQVDDLIQKQLDLARSNDLATRMVALDNFGVSSARALAEQALVRSSHDWTGVRATDELWSAKSVVDEFLARDDALQKLLGFSNLNSISTTVAEAQARLDRSDAFSRVMMGPLSDLRAVGVFDHLNSAAVLKASDYLTNYESKFRVATAVDVSAFHDIGLRANTFASMFDRQIAAALPTIDSPFVKIADPVSSVSAFAELQGMSRAVSSLAPFDRALTDGLRANLGDWRDIAVPIDDRLIDVTARSDFYVRQGFKPELTDFPTEAFEIAVEGANLTAEGLILVENYDEPIEPGENEDSSAFERTNLAHMWLLRFETQIRDFIDRLMTAEFGADWPRRQLPNGMYEKWVDKQTKSKKAGMPDRPIIVFADFTEYEPIITKRDNWKVFQGYFSDVADVRESLRRMQLPRLETMHARPLSLDDHLFLLLEIKRLARAFKKS